MENFIQLKKDNIVRIGIKDNKGNDTGEHLEFDLEDIELPLRYQECIEKHKKNLRNLKNEFVIIDKRQDVKGKKLLSKNEEDKLVAMRKFYLEEEIALDMFLGSGGTQKLLNGRQPYYSMYDDINEMLEPVLPIIKKGFDSIENKIKEKYKSEKKESNVLE